MGFDPDDVEKLRSHQLPVVCGIYAKKGKREFTCKFLPETQKIAFGKGGGLIEIMYAATGFLYLQRQVYLDIQSKLNLPVCNTMFGESVTPWFQPLVRDYQNGHWYLGEDFSFCERARLAGYKIIADTSIRLMHYGNYPFGWEDVGKDIQRFASYEFHIQPDEKATGQA